MHAKLGIKIFTFEPYNNNNDDDCLSKQYISCIKK